MPSIADQLMEQRADVLARAQKTAQDAADSGREWTAEDDAKIAGMAAEADRLLTRASELREGEERANAFNEKFYNVTGKQPAVQHATVEDLGQWARTARLGEGFEVPMVRGAAQRAINAYKRGPAALFEQRAMSASGGVAPDSVYDQLWQYAVAGSQLLQAGTQVIETSDGNTLPLPVATAHATTGTPTPTVVAANAALTASDSTITTVNLPVSKYGYMTLVPTELVQDANFDLNGYLAFSAGRDLARTLSAIGAAAAIAGFTTVGFTGTTGSSTSLGTQGTAGQGTDAIFQLFHSVIPEYRTNAAWCMADPSIMQVRLLKTTQAAPVWQPALTAGDPDLIVGKPVYVVPQLPTMAANAKPIYFGEWAALKVRIAGGIRFERSDQYGFGNDQIAFRAIVRTGAVTVDPNAVKFYQNSAT